MSRTHARLSWLQETVGIEVKIKGTRAQIIRQLARYARNDCTKEIILASTSRRILASIPSEITDVPIAKHLLQGGLL